MNKYLGILISFIAGMSTIIGYFSIYIKGSKDRIISYSLAFSSGVMIMISIIDLIPSSISYLNLEYGIVISIVYCIAFFLLGFIICFITEKKLENNDELYKTGLISMIGLIIHNLPEGIITYALSSFDLKLGILFAIAIIMHNIPEGISISIPIYYSTKNKKKALFYTVVSGFSELLGAIISMIFLYRYLNSEIIGITYSIVSGIMLYIGFFKMYVESKKHGYKVNNIILVGMLFILLIEIVLKAH